MVLFFSVRGEEKCEINYKKQKIYFVLFGSFLGALWTIFGRLFAGKDD